VIAVSQEGGIERAAAAVAVASIISSLKSLGVEPDEAAGLIYEVERRASGLAAANLPHIELTLRVALEAGLEEHLAIGVACTPLVAAGRQIAEFIAAKESKT